MVMPFRDYRVANIVTWVRPCNWSEENATMTIFRPRAKKESSRESTQDSGGVIWAMEDGMNSKHESRIMEGENRISDNHNCNA
jgi:hypothetical protein